MKYIVIKALAFSAVVAIAWHVGGMIPAHTMTLFSGFLFGSFVGIPAMLILATNGNRVRHDHYVHAPTETSVGPREQLVQLSAKPTRYIVVADRATLPTVDTHSRLEVKR